MKYIYSNTSVPNGNNILPTLNRAAERLFNKINPIELSSIGISEYNQRYIGQKLDNHRGTLQLYCHLLSLSLSNMNIPLNDFVFVDYGGGSGLLSMLAKELGIGTVIYNDIYDVSCQDAKTLAETAGYTIDHFVHGDIDDLIEYLNNNNISLNAITSYDVIEHIYDIEAYLNRLSALSSYPFRIVFGSAANIKNPRIRNGIMKHHLTREHKNKEKTWGHKGRDTLNSFYEIRKLIIREYDTALDENTITAIAKATRGLIQKDIEKCVDDYKKSGKINYRPDHVTNTCDPYTGNWAEHLMEPEWLEDILRKNNFRAETLSGLHAHTHSTMKNVIKSIINLYIRVFGKKALFVAPYYIIFADYNINNN